MSSDSDSHLSFACPHCKHPLKVPVSVAGKRALCPACRGKLVVPSKSDTFKEAKDADAWLQLDDPTHSSPKSQPAQSQPAQSEPNPPRPGASSFDDDLPELAPLPLDAEPSYDLKVETGTVANTTDRERQARDEAALGAYLPESNDEEFAFPCKVCGSLLYTSLSRVGTMTRCPDCHSEFSVPSRPTKQKRAQIKIDHDVADVRLAPVEVDHSRHESGQAFKTKEILDRAAMEADRERKELESLAVPFDSQRWLSLLFGCFRDPGVILLAVILGIFAAACFFLLHIAGRFELTAVGIGMLRGVIFMVLGIPILISILMCCMVIIPMAANRLRRVEDWPFGRFGEAIGEVWIMLSAIVMAAIPAGILATMLSWGGVPLIVREILILISIWGLTPFLLLSMIENNAVSQPFSKIIFDSVTPRADAWGAMYFQTGLAIACLFVLYAIAAMTSPVMTAVFGFLFPAGLFLIANQYGVLAGRISDITNLGFEGDFSEDVTS